METERLIDSLFRSIESKGLRAIAKSNDEAVRTELLGLLESVALYRVKIHEALKTQGVDKVLLREGEPITEEIISRLEGKSEIIILTKDSE
jgi:hypothetical protein